MTAKKKRTSSDPAPVPQKKKSAKPPAPPASEPKAPPAPAVPAAPSKLSALDAAARVLRESGQPMSCPELIGQMAARGYWTSPQGQTPASTLYAAIAREVKLKGAASRFVKTGSGRFAARDGADA
jgi:hypothetical protein